VTLAQKIYCTPDKFNKVIMDAENQDIQKSINQCKNELIKGIECE